MYSTVEQGELTQAQKDYGLLDSIGFFEGQNDVEQWILKGANVNAIGVNWRTGMTQEPPLALATRLHNYTAVEVLLAYKANPSERTKTGQPIILAAVNSGCHLSAEMLLKHSPALVDCRMHQSGWHNMNLLHYSLLKLAPFSLIQHGEWESRDMQDLLIDYFDNEPVQRPTHPLTVRYFGGLNMATALLNAHPRLFLLKTDEGVSPYDIVCNPRAYKDRFFDINGDETIRCLTAADDPNPNVLSFQVDLCNNIGMNRFVAADDNDPRPPITVIFDFTKLQKLFRACAEKQVDFSLVQELHQHDKRLQVVQQQLGDFSEKQADFLGEQQEKKEQKAFKAWLEKPGHENLKIFHDKMNRLEDVILSFKVASTDLIPSKLRDRQVDLLKSMLGATAGLVSVLPLIGNTTAATVQFFKKESIKLLKFVKEISPVMRLI